MKEFTLKITLSADMGMRDVADHLRRVALSISTLAVDTYTINGPQNTGLPIREPTRNNQVGFCRLDEAT